MAAKKGPAMRRTGASVEGFLARVPDGQRREDARRLCAMMQQITGEPPMMWGSSIIGFGMYVKRLDDVDQDALRELIDRSVRVRKGVDRAST